ncbi:MAG TPA: DNA-binding transcriptional regulator [Anaerohalosphaeraceae bacterium]|nr:DNA-binding transcriptional regulator [Anaerohalosphaeraceae bacterium]
MLIESSRGNVYDFLSGISKYADEHGPWLFHFGEPGPFYRKGQDKIVRKSTFWPPQWTPSGVITCNYDLTRKYTDKRIPTILTTESNSEGSNLPKIVIDHDEIGRMAAKEYLNRGYRYFGYCGFDEYIWSVKRGNSYKKYLEDKGFEVYRYQPVKPNSSRRWEKERIALAKWLHGLPKPIGIFTCDDTRGRDVIEICSLEQCEIPGQVAVLGADSDSIICNSCSPPLSSIKLDFINAGYKAAELLDKLMRGEKPSLETILVHPLEVETRRSTDITAVHDTDVKEAIRFIHNHIYENIQVNDVVYAISVPKRKLQDKFYALLGRTISEEIKRIRADKISQMLLKTDMSVQQITLKFGHYGLRHVARFYKRQTGLTPTEFRHKYGRGRLKMIRVYN